MLPILVILLYGTARMCHRFSSTNSPQTITPVTIIVNKFTTANSDSCFDKHRFDKHRRCKSIFDFIHTIAIAIAIGIRVTIADSILIICVCVLVQDLLIITMERKRWYLIIDKLYDIN